MDNKAPSVRSGYTLPVFACAAAIAAYRKLQRDESLQTASIDLVNPAQTVSIPVEQVARLGLTSALAVTYSDPGDNLDLTRHTPIWAKVEWNPDQSVPIQIEGGEGIGRKVHDSKAAIYAYAEQLIQDNLKATLVPGDRIRVTIILPEGKALAKRTSNEAFGVVEGLSLLGTSGIAQALSAPAQLEAFQSELRQKAQQKKPLVFCLGENGLDIARRLGIPESQLLKTANWIGPMLVLAGQEHIPAILLLGYHGKLIKLAGGIFHTHHHLADGRQEILTAIAAGQHVPPEIISALLASPTIEAGLQHLRKSDQNTGKNWAELVYNDITKRIESRAKDYIDTHSQTSVRVGCLLFNRAREIFARGSVGQEILVQILASQG